MMLYMTGSSFESIAKWIGHSTPQVTSSVYGRLSQQDAEASLENVPFLSSTGRNEVRKEWMELATFLKEPYHFSETEQHDRTTTKPTTAMRCSSSLPMDGRPTKQMKHDLLARARAQSTESGPLMTVQNLALQLQEQMNMLQSLQNRPTQKNDFFDCSVCR